MATDRESDSEDEQTYQVVFTKNGESIERVYGEAKARQMYALATSGPYYERVALERWDGITFVSESEWSAKE